ncbi:unnamed protein product [Rotaria sordida]|uniref:PDZ domain-containing protein n=1 Tax=Rotaria sordida TaxID=392033 RepID=A0A815GP83_9BILA|nr:unnamed protein product [Rotaria sordida]
MNEHSRSILHRIELRRRSERDKFGFAIQYEQPCSICVYSGSLAQASGLRSGQILAKVNGYNVLDARHDDVKRLVYAKHTNLLVLEVLDPDDDIDEDDSIECKENILSPSPCRITSKISVNDALRGRILRDVNLGSSSTTNKYPIKHYYKKARESLTSSSQDSTTSTTSDPIFSHHKKSFPNINRQRLSKVLISTNLRMLLSQINDIILLKDMYSSLTPGVNLIDSQSSLSFNHQTLYTFSSINFLGYFDIDHNNNNNQNELVKKIQKFLKRSILNSTSNKIEFRIQCKQFQISPLWFKFLAGKYLSYICLFHTQPTLFALILYCSIKIDENINKFKYEHNSSSMFVFRASSIDERNRIIQCLFNRAKHCSNHQCTMEDKHKKNKLDEPVKRDTSSSSPNFHHHQTANASTNTPLYDNYYSSITNKSALIELTPISCLNKTPTTSSSIYLQTPPSSPLLTIGNFYKINKYSSNINQQDSSLFNVASRSDTNQDNNDKKFIIEHPSISSIDLSRFCRFIFPDSTSTVILTHNSTNTIQKTINRLFAKRGLTWYRTELYSIDQQSIDIQEPLSTLSGKEIYVETRILIRIDFPTKTLCVRCNPKRTLLQILQPVVEKLNYSIGHFVFYANNSLMPLNLNEIVECYDNQRIFTLIRTASGVEMSTRQKVRTANDIFEMISENDEDIKFDECGILQVVTQSKSTSVDDYLFFSTPETSLTQSEKDQIYCGPRR